MSDTRKLKRHQLRAHYVAQIEAMLKERGVVRKETICLELGLNHNTAGAYLGHMYRDLRMIRKHKSNAHNAIEWELGEDPTLPAEGEAETAQRTVPARQIGMWRDALVAALFGPAQGACA